MQSRILVLVSIVTTANTAPKKFTPTALPSNVPMAWLDGRNRQLGEDETPEIDTFYDRIACIGFYHTNKYVCRTLGVYITYYRVLTSFNALKVHTKDPVMRKIYKVISLQDRLLNDYPHISYTYVEKGVMFGRQVVPYQDDVAGHMRHGPHSPHHDLMILRIDGNLKTLYPEPNRLTELSKGPTHKAGPSLTKYADSSHVDLDNLNFVSLGHINDEHIRNGRFLEKEDILPEDDVITDCDEWIPREWGRFICLRNVNNYSGIASGALLFSHETVVGVGAFAIWRASGSVLLFTDIRPYKPLILETCTGNDHNLVLPKPEF